MNDKTSFRKRHLMKSLCGVVLTYTLVILIISIQYLNIKRMENLLSSSGLLSINSDTRQRNMPPYNDDWKHVSDMVYVYSAFWEYRTNPTMVRIIGIGRTKQNYTQQLSCLLKYAEDDIAVIPATSKTFEDHHCMELAATFFYCKTEVIPEKVALVSSGSTSVSWLLVHDTNPGHNVSRNNIVLCTQPLYKDYKHFTSFKIAEFIAYYEIVGVSHFAFYDYKTDSEVKAYLNSLMEAGTSVKLLPWTLPKKARNVWNAGQDASIADCVYRHASSYEYAAIVDFDEYIVPAAYVTLQKLLQIITETNNSKWSSYMFRHAVFCLDYPDDPLAKNLALPFVTQIKTKRGDVWLPYERAKSIVRPSAVVLPGIHYTWEALPTWNKSLEINPSFALLHHYRGRICDIRNKRIDRIAWRYRSELLKSNAVKVWKNIHS